MALPRRVRFVLLGVLVAVIPPQVANANECNEVPGFDYAAFSNNNIQLSGGTTINSYDSSAGTYAATSSSTGGSIGTNSTSAGGVVIEGSSTHVHGTISVGTGGNTGTVITAPSGSYTTSDVLTAPVTLTPVVVPTIGTNQGDKTINNISALAPNQTYGAVLGTGGGTIQLSAGTYVMDSLTLGGNATLSVTSAPVVVYIKNSMDLSGGTVVNGSLKSTDLVFFGAPTCTTVTFKGGANAAFAVYAPSAAITVTGNADVYGAVVGASVTAAGGAKIHYDKALGAYGGGSFSCFGLEVSRAAPIVGVVNDVESYVQGSFMKASPDEPATTFSGTSAAGFWFPHRTGHVYGYNASSIGTSATTITSLGTPLWDSSSQIPNVTTTGCTNPFAGTCRTMFTTVATGAAPARIMFNTTNRSQFGSYLGGSLSTTDQTTLIGLVMAGRYDASNNRKPNFGGVDRSSVAIIETSPHRPGVRAKMIYVNALDGMLHALCGEILGNCTAVGRELWAYLPRTQLGTLRLNTQKLNGSPKAGDFIANFDGVAGNEWRTVLAFQSGSGTASTYADAPSVTAVDITDPFSPQVLWEVATPATRGTSELGVGLDIVMASVLINGQSKPAVFVSTNQGGTGSAGVRVMAYSAVDGAALWSSAWTYTYPAQRVSGSGPVPATGIPGGLAAYDQGDTGTINRLAVPTLYGDLFVLNAETGVNVYGNNPVFRFSADKKPIGAAPALYKNEAGAYFAVMVSGGYVDDSVGATWSSGTQYVAAVKLDVEQNLTPLTELGSDNDNRPFVEEFTGRGFAQATVAGGEVFVLTASTDVNTVNNAAAGTGTMIRINLETHVAQTYPVGSSGAASTEVVNGMVYVSGTTNTMKVEPSGFVTAGVATELHAVSKALRRFWLSN